MADVRSRAIVVKSASARLGRTIRRSAASLWGLRGAILWAATGQTFGNSRKSARAFTGSDQVQFFVSETLVIQSLVLGN